MSNGEERTYVDAKLENIECSVRRVEQFTRESAMRNDETHDVIMKRVAQIEASVHDGHFFLRILRWCALIGLGLYAALKSGSLDPLRELIK